MSPAWAAWRPADCLPDACFCEALREGVLRQPANTWSCLAFVAAGLLIAGAGERDGGSPPPSAPAFAGLRGVPAWYGLGVAAIGAGSAFFHASLTFAGQCLDNMAMVLLPSFILLYNALRSGRLPLRAFPWAYLAVNAGLAGAIVAGHSLRRPLFAALSLGALASEALLRRGRPVRMRDSCLYGAAAAMALGTVVWTLDLTRTVCAPRGLLQGHALWHLLGAAAAGLLFLYYRSEAPAPAP